MKILYKKLKQSIIKLAMYLKINSNKFKDGLGERGVKIFKNFSFYLLLITIAGFSKIVLATDDPLTVVNNLSNFIFALVRAIGMIILVFSIVQIGLSFKSHDPSQRASGILTFGGGLVITFSKEILDIITR